MKTYCFIALLLFGATNADAKVKLVATTSDLASIAEEVGGDRVEIDTIADGRRDPHYVEILPSYMLKLRKADVFLQVGLELELWAPQLVQGARNRKLQIVDCSEGVQPLNVPSTVSMSEGDIHTQGNPHYWLDPRNGKIIAANIMAELIHVDPEGAPYYRERFARFEAAIDERMTRWKQTMAPHEGTQMVFFHDSWPYFEQAFGVHAAAFIEPKPGVSPSPGHTAEVIRLIQVERIPVVCVANYFDRRVPERIAEQSGAKLVVLATSVGGIDGADDYFSLFDANLARLHAALGQ